MCQYSSAASVTTWVIHERRVMAARRGKGIQRWILPGETVLNPSFLLTRTPPPLCNTLDSYLQHTAPVMLHTQGHSVRRTDGAKGRASHSDTHTYDIQHPTHTHKDACISTIDRKRRGLYLIPLQQRTRRQSKTLLFYTAEGGWRTLRF